MLKFGLIAVIGTLTVLSFSSRTNAALTSEASILGNLVDKGVSEPAHYGKRHGGHCGMREYSHEHRWACQRVLERSYGTENKKSWRRRPFGAGGRPAEN